MLLLTVHDKKESNDLRMKLEEKLICNKLTFPISIAVKWHRNAKVQLFWRAGVPPAVTFYSIFALRLFSRLSRHLHSRTVEGKITNYLKSRSEGFSPRLISIFAWPAETRVRLSLSSLFNRRFPLWQFDTIALLHYCTTALWETRTASQLMLSGSLTLLH